MKHVLSVLALAGAACACGPAGEPGETKKPPFDAALAQIVVENLKTHYEYLASDALEGRMTGEPGYDLAAEYVRGQFAAMGLSPGGEDGWYQQVPLVSYQIDTDSATFIVHKDGEDIALEYREDFGMSGDQLRGETRVRGEVVYVGYGVHAPELGYSDYEGVDVEGRIVALFSGAPDEFPHNQRAFYASADGKARELARRGATGSIALRSRHAQQSFSWERYKKAMGSKPGMTWLDEDGNAAGYHEVLRGSAVLGEDAASRLMKDAPITFEEALDAIEASRPASTPLGFEATLARKTTHERITSPNVIGLVRGSDPDLAGEYVVYTAHLDHLGIGVAENGDAIYNGAYDNAMGISLMLEAARALAASPPRRSVLFIALTAEERGLLGSEYFAEYPTVPADSIVANVNLDMPLFLYPVADVVAFGEEHSSLGDVVESTVADYGFRLAPDPIPEEAIFIRSDQYSFVRKGVPAIYLISGYTSADPHIDGEALFREHIAEHYHRPSDDLSRPVHWPSVLSFARANAAIGREIGDADARPAWNEGDFFGERFAAGD